MTHRQTQLFLALTLATLAQSGCRVGPKYQRPPALAQAPPSSYKESPANQPSTNSEWKVAQPQDAMLRGKWWEIYGDPELNALEEKLNIDNQNIKQRFASYMESRTLIAQARSQLFPTLSVGPTYTHSELSANNTSNAAAAAGISSSATVPTNRQTSSISLPFDASWEPDLWGRVRNQIDAARYNAQVSAADLESERLSEESSLATTYFQIRGQDALRAILDETVASDQKALDYTRAQYETGVGTEISVVEAQNTLQSAQATATNLGVLRAQYEHSIAVLAGANPSTFSIPVKPLDAKPPVLPIGLPSQLLERRPDVAATERSMAAANAQIGVAEASYFPSVTLSASGGLQSATWKHLFDVASRFWSVGPAVSETIYDGGLRRATVQEYIQAYNANVATYRQTVLTAFQQVEDALAAERLLTQQVLLQQDALASAQRVVDLETTRYQTGIDPYINVVTAQNTLLGNQETLASVRTQEMTSSVQLVVALGGGWDSSQLATPAQVSQRPARADTVTQK